MNLDYFKEHKFVSAILIVLVICVCRMCMYQRVIRNGQVYIINKITNSYYIQENSHSPFYKPWYKKISEHFEKPNNDSQKTYSDEEIKQDFAKYGLSGQY